MAQEGRLALPIYTQDATAPPWGAKRDRIRRGPQGARRSRGLKDWTRYGTGEVKGQVLPCRLRVLRFLDRASEVLRAVSTRPERLASTRQRVLGGGSGQIIGRDWSGPLSLARRRVVWHWRLEVEGEGRDSTPRDSTPSLSSVPLFTPGRRDPRVDHL